MSLTKSSMNNYIISNFIASYLDEIFKFSIVDIMHGSAQQRLDFSRYFRQTKLF